MQFLDKIRKFIKDNSLMSPVEVSLGNLCSSGSLPTEGSPMLITSEYVPSGGRGLNYLFPLAIQGIVVSIDDIL